MIVFPVVLLDQGLVNRLTNGVVMARALALGDLNMDISLAVPRLPAAGGDGIADSQRVGMGGSAANTAVCLQRLGSEAALVCCIGSDRFGDEALAELAAAGVDVSLIRRTEEEETSLNVVAVTPDGERTMIAYRGASRLLDPADLPLGAIAGAGFLHVSGYAALASPQYEAALQALRVARTAGVPTSLDVPTEPPLAVPQRVRALMALADVVVLGPGEAASLGITGDGEEIARGVQALGVRSVAVKLGERGGLLASGPDVYRASSPRVTVVDTTGAGDAFCAGIVHGWVTDLGPGGALELAVRCGAAAVGRRGAGLAMPGAADVAAPGGR